KAKSGKAKPSTWMLGMAHCRFERSRESPMGKRLAAEEFRQLLDRLASAWAKHDYAAVAREFSEEVRYGDPTRYSFQNRRASGVFRKRRRLRATHCLAHGCFRRSAADWSSRVHLRRHAPLSRHRLNPRSRWSDHTLARISTHQREAMGRIRRRDDVPMIAQCRENEQERARFLLAFGGCAA